MIAFNAVHAEISWTLSDDGTLTISGTGEMGTNPWSSQRKIIEKVVIENGVTSIGGGAFWECYYLKSVVIPSSVTSIGGYAFSNCYSLTSITIPNSVTSIGGGAFNGCYNLKSVVIPNSVTSIEERTFSGCTGLTSITIPNSVASIGNEVFRGCSDLTSITIPGSVTSIGENALDGTNWYNNQPDGLIYAGSCLYKYKGTMPANTKIVIKDGTKGIGGSAFSGSSGLTSVTIPNSVTNIGGSAFSGCSSLTSITIPNYVTSIGDGVFEGCEVLNSVTIPNSVTSIGNSAFSDCSNLTSITIPNSVTSIGGSAFSGCSALTSITIPNSVTSIGGVAFEGCNALTSVTIPNSLTSIEYSTFSGCSSLTSITIPNSVTSIGGSAFRDCSGLTSITIPNSVMSIEDYTFSGCYRLTSITIPSSVTSIGYGAFKDCSGFTSVTIGSSVTSIGSEAFCGAKLRNIVIKAETPPNITNIKNTKAFSNQSYYHTTLMIPEGCWDAYAYDDDWYQFINIREMAYNATNLTNSKAYTMKSATEGAYLFYDSVNDCVGTLNETVLDDTEANNTWMSVEIDGKHYVYNLGAKKFLVSDKNASKTGYSLSDTPVSIDVEDGKDAIVFGKGKEFYMVINEKLNVDEGLETLIMTSTGIKETSVDSNMPTVIYNQNGQRINRSHVLNGVYIKNGKKVIVK